jgi:uncharacterized protein
MIDRLQPTRRPAEAVRGYQKWRSLLFMHWPVPIRQLRPLVPAGLELDLLDGEAYIGVLPFRMHDVRPKWWPKACALDLLELNVRTYVYYRDRPGIYFFSLDASSRLAVLGARLLWGLPYYLADMQMVEEGGTVDYQSTRRSSRLRHHVRYRVGEMLGPAPLGSIEFFFLERYLLFLESQSRLYSGQIHHAPYPAQKATVDEVQDELVASLGLDGVSGRPRFAHFASGVDVEIFGLQLADRKASGGD